MKPFFLSFIISLNFAASSAQLLPSKAEILGSMRLANDHWILVNTYPGNNQWARAAYFTGNMAMYGIYPKQNYIDYALNWAEVHDWGLNGGVQTRNADNQCAGQTYIDLFWLDGGKDSSRISDINESIDRMVNSATSTDWWWIDALYMAMPVFTRLGILHDDDSYFSKMYALYYNTKIERGLFNSETGLWYRDESFKPPYTTPNGMDSYWARGNGWVFAAHARVLDLLPADDVNRDEYIETFQKMALALKTRQREDGFWNVSLDDPDDFGGPETSGTSFFTYGIAWGINKGYLDSATYYPVVAKSWEGLTAIALHDDGFLGYVQGVGVGPASSQPVTYESTTDFGVGALLLAGGELVKLAQGEMPFPATFYIDSIKVLNKNILEVFFNDSLEVKSATDPDNFSIPGKEILYLELNEDKKSVRLYLDGLDPGPGQLSVENVWNTSDKLIEEGLLYGFYYYGDILISASGFQSGTVNYPRNTMDNDLNTRWSMEGSGQWIQYDLGEKSLVSSVDIAFYNGDTRYAYFSISLSIDGIHFTEVFNGQSDGSTLDLQNFDFDDMSARFVRITGYGNSSNLWNSITEVVIHTVDSMVELLSIELDSGELDQVFDPSLCFYTATIPHGIKELNIHATPSDPEANVTGDGVVQVYPGTILVEIEVNSADGSATKTYIIILFIEAGLGYNANHGLSMNLFPNPFSNLFTLQCKGRFHYSIFAMNGMLLTIGNSEDFLETGDELKKGAYILKIDQADISSLIKLIKF